MNKKTSRRNNLDKKIDHQQNSPSIKQLGSLSSILSNKKLNTSSKNKKYRLLDQYLKSSPTSPSKTYKSLDLSSLVGKKTNSPSIKQLGSLSSILSNKKLTTSSKNKKYRLLDQYLKSSPTSPSKTYKSLDLSSLVGKKTNSPSIKQLGSLSSILTTDEKTTTLPQKAASHSPYQDKNIFHSEPSSSSKKTKDVSSFSTTKKKLTSPLKNFSLVALSVFALGVCLFALGQLIKNANLNFASQPLSDAVDLETPRVLTFQGRLTDYDQNSISQLKNMSFAMYNASGGNSPPPIGGKIIWNSNLCQISPDKNGVFTVNLGAGAGQDRDNINCGASLGNIFTENSSIWLQITIENEILFPRQLIKSVPYALNSETLQGFPASQSATPNTIPVLDAQGNLKFNTQNSSFINFGQLNLVSETGDLYLLPGSGNVYIGQTENPANLIISGDATISGNLNLTTSPSSSILFGENGLNFKSQISQDLWQTQLSIAQNGYLGIGTNKPQQKLSLDQGNFQFTFNNGPSIKGLKLSEDVIEQQALTRISAPSQSLQLNSSPDGDSSLSPGQYQYAYTFVTQTGTESDLSPISSFELKQPQPILINNLNFYPQINVIARNIYRTKANGKQFFLLKTITDNLSTSTIDTLNDNQLNQPFPNLNNTGNYRYKITFTTTDGETAPSLASNTIKVTGDGKVIKIDNLPLATSSEKLISRNIYRSLCDSHHYYLIANIKDNNTTTFYDHLNDHELSQKPFLPSAGGIYANQSLSLQLQSDGTITTEGNLVANQRIESSHGQNQGLKLPSSLGKPQVQTGQQIGDIVYDSLNQLLYIYNGQDFINFNNNNNVSPTPISSENDSTYCTNNSCRITFEPEYAGAVITGDGDQNQGIYSSGTENSASNHRFNYYHWISPTNSLQDFDNTINIIIPQNFLNWQSQGLTLDYLTQSSNPENNAVNLEIYNGQNNTSFNKNNQVSDDDNTWMSSLNHRQPLIITNEELSTLNLKAGDRLTLKIKTLSQTQHQVKIGQINLNYHSRKNLNNPDQSIWRQLAGAISPTNSQSDFLLGGDSTASAKVAFLNLANTGTPTLYLKGNLFLDNPNKKNYLDLATQSSFNIRTQNPDKSYNELFTILPNGNIGIGTSTPTEKLEVTGNIKIGGSLQLLPMNQIEAGACTPEFEGKIYYDYQLLKFYACQAQDISRQAFAWTPLN